MVKGTIGLEDRKGNRTVNKRVDDRALRFIQSLTNKTWMPGARLELARPLGAVDFESTASANSAIPA
jgi:hypothetical protein